MLTYDQIREIVDSTDNLTFSLYLHVDPAHQPNQGQSPAWRISAKNALRDVENSLPETVDETRWNHMRKQVEAQLEAYDGGARTLVLFASDNEVQTYELGIALDTAYRFGNAYVLPLIWAVDEFEPYLVVLVDQENARFLTAYLGRVDSKDTMSIDFDAYDFGEKRYVNRAAGGNPATGGNAGATKDQFDDMKDAHLKRFYADVAEHARGLLAEIDAERIILGGSGQSAHRVHDALPEPYQEQVVGVLAIPENSADHEVAELIQKAALAYERDYESQWLTTVIDAARAGGRGALGQEDVEHAFTMKQVEQLLLPYPLEEEERPLAHRLTMQALELNASIELLHGEPAARLREAGGVAARLYYPLRETQSQ